MVYGGIENKWASIDPIFARVRFIHGRIGNPGNIQVDVGDGNDRVYVDHFKELWTRCFTAFLKSAQPREYICFVPELLPSDICYARTFSDANGQLREEGDRWQQALLYKDLAKACWKEALTRA
jgi:hypothetical protein